MQAVAAAARQGGWPLLALSTGILGLHVVVALTMAGPSTLDSELGFLAMARALAGATDIPDLSAFTPTNYPAFALLLVPVSWVSDDLVTAYQTALLANAVIATLTVPLAFIVSRVVLRVDRSPALVLSAAVGLYTPLFVGSAYAWAESLLAFALLGLVLAAWIFVSRPAVHAGVIFGAVLGLLTVTHPRTYPVVGVAIIWIVVFAARNPRWRGAAFVAAVVAIAMAALGRVLAAVAISAIYGSPSFVASEVSRYLKIVTTPELAVKGLLAGAGSLWYLTVSTLGLSLLAIALLVRVAASGRLLRPHGLLRRDLAWLLLAICLIAVIFSGAGMASTFDAVPRMDYRFYGRYVDVFAPILIVVAGAYLARAAPRLRALATLLTVPGLVVLASAIYAGFGSDAFSGAPIGGQAVLGIISWGWLSYPQTFEFSFPLWTVTFACASVIVLLSALATRWRSAFVCTCSVVFLASSFTALQIFVRPLAADLTASFSLQDRVAVSTAVPVVISPSTPAVPASMYQFLIQGSRVTNNQPSPSVIIAPDSWRPNPPLEATVCAREKPSSRWSNGIVAWSVTEAGGSAPTCSD